MECEENEAKLHEVLNEIEESFGGDVDYFPVISEEQIKNFEIKINWELPQIFRYFYRQETNGLIANDKRILGFYDKDQKKTWVENLERYNDPEKSPWFKKRSFIFDDYVIIGLDQGLLFCISKKYDFDNPLVYVTDNANSSHGVDFERLDMDLTQLISTMIEKAF